MTAVSADFVNGEVNDAGLSSDETHICCSRCNGHGGTLCTHVRDAPRPLYTSHGRDKGKKWQPCLNATVYMTMSGK